MMSRVADAPASSRLHPLSLLIAVTIMLVCTLYPPLMASVDGKADHGLATALFTAMSVAFVRGVGFVPRARVWRWLFSGWTCLVALAWACWVKFIN